MVLEKNNSKMKNLWIYQDLEKHLNDFCHWELLWAPKVLSGIPESSIKGIFPLDRYILDKNVESNKSPYQSL